MVFGNKIRPPLEIPIRRRGAENDEASRRNLRDVSLSLSARSLRILRLVCSTSFQLGVASGKGQFFTRRQVMKASDKLEACRTTRRLCGSAMWLLCLLAACAISVQAQDADYQTAVSFVQQGQFD